MQDYLVRYIGAEKALGGRLASGLDTGPKLPKFLQDELVWPYLGGAEFIQSLWRTAGGKWTLVNLADRVRTPDSTEQVMHSEKWLAVEKPLAVRFDTGLHDPWRRTAAGTWGEWQTRELLGGDDRAAAGWGGDRYELWQRGTCSSPPCRDSDVLVMRWRWDDVRDAREFEAALRVDGATVRAHGDTVTLVLAPTAALARRVLARASGA
jgi:hypothetical protein